MILYNEIDPYACAWMRNLVEAEAIAPGEVIEEDISKLDPDRVRNVTQFHAFAGIGVWSYALELAGWPQDAPVWTGSCPCQPFSAAGQRKGSKDSRHLWPAWFALIRECLPPVIFGEQVASRDGRVWLSAVRADLETLGYAVGAADLCAASVGAPHIRQRLYFVAYSPGVGRQEHGRRQGEGKEPDVENGGQPGGVVVSDLESLQGHRFYTEPSEGDQSRGTGLPGPLGYSDSPERQACDFFEERAEARSERVTQPGLSGALANTLPAGRPEGWTRTRCGQTPSSSSVSPLADAECHDGGADVPQRQAQGGDADGGPGARPERLADTGRERRQQDPGSALSDEKEDGGARRDRVEPDGNNIPGGNVSDGFWSDADWLPCTDGKARPVEPGAFPLVNGTTPDMGSLRPGEASPFRIIKDPKTGRSQGQAPWRIGMLKGYGNAIVAHCAATFIRSAKGAISEAFQIGKR